MSFTSEIEFKQLLHAIPDGLLLVDEDGQIKDANVQATELFGYSIDELRNEPVEMLVPDKLRDQHQEHRRAYLSDPVRRSMGSGMQLVGRRKDGSFLPVDIGLAPIEKGDETWVIASVRDVSERVERQQRLSVLTRILRHDIRNRLMIILGNAELCKESLEEIETSLQASVGTEYDDSTISAAVVDLQEQSDELIELLAELDEFTDLGMAEVEQIIAAANELESIAQRAHRANNLLGTGGEQPKPIELEPILETAVTTTRKAYPEATLEANLEANGTVRQPRDMVRIVVEELLRNGIEHTDTPKPYVSIETSVPQPSSFEITITDEGPGLPEEEKQTLTLREEQPLMHSMGFGLWEVNWIVSKMGGCLTFEENEPRGTIATIRLPIDPKE